MGNAVENPTVGTDLAAVHDALQGPEWLRGVRDAARRRFDKLAWPTTMEEEWRRTNLSAFEFDAYTSTAVDAAAVHVVIGSENRLEFDNSRLSSATLTQIALDNGVYVGGLATLPDSVEKRIAPIVLESAQNADNRVLSWHYGLLTDSAVIHVPAGVTLADPVVVDVRVTGDETVVAPHLMVVAERGSQVTVVRRIHGDEEGEVMIVDGADLLVGENARLSLVNCQFANDESLYFQNDRCSIARDGYIHRTDATLGSDFVKSRFSCSMDGPGSDAVINGVYFATDEQHMDIRTVQHHRAPHATSRSYYRGAVRDESHAIYQGLIQVAGSAPGTDAYLTNKNLILGEEARADSIPSLNIKTDDVRCSHGSTTGKLDETQIYYLQSRGFPIDEARRTLIQGYFDDLVSMVPSDFADQIRERIAARVPE